jgi:DNA N-6-adenine-methyltransferase (Dam)
MAEHENSIGASDDWHTPASIFAALKLPNGAPLRFALDPCAPPDRTYYFVPADRFYTKEDDGLTQPWFGRVFVNPPFGGRRGHVPWLLKFFAHGDGIAICRAYTSSDWWHEVVIPNVETLLFPRGKTKFIRPDGIVGTAPGHGIALIGMGQICNDALRNSGLGWFNDLHLMRLLQNEIAKLEIERNDLIDEFENAES